VPPRGKLQPFHGASTRLLADLHRHGDVRELQEWSAFVRNPHHRRWLRQHEDAPDHEVADALWARERLEHTIRKLPRRSARELRELVNRLDDLC
jgi:hypothetical protein